MTDFKKLCKCFDELGIEVTESDRYVGTPTGGHILDGRDIILGVGKYDVVFEFNERGSLQEVVID